MTLSRLLRIWRHRIRSVAKPDQLDTELRREVAFHFDRLVQEFTADGLPPDDATAGGAARPRQRGGGRGAMPRRAAHDLAARFLAGPDLRPRHAAKEAGVHGHRGRVAGHRHRGQHGGPRRDGRARRRGLSFPNADRLVLIRTFPLDNPQRNNNATVPDYFAWKTRSRAFEAIGASLAEQKDLGAETDGGPAVRMSGMGLSPGVFQALGVQPILGRVFTDAESQVGNPAPVIVISQEFWQRQFAAAPDIINTSVRLNGVPTTIIGVMPPGFRFPNSSVDYWAPLPLNEFQLQGSARLFMVTARLKPGVTVQQAERDVAAINAQLAAEFPDRPRGLGRPGPAAARRVPGLDAAAAAHVRSRRGDGSPDCLRQRRGPSPGTGLGPPQ